MYVDLLLFQAYRTMSDVRLSGMQQRENAKIYLVFFQNIRFTSAAQLDHVALSPEGRHSPLEDQGKDKGELRNKRDKPKEGQA